MCVDTPVFPLKRNLDLLISCQCTNLLHATCWLSKKTWFLSRFTKRLNSSSVCAWLLGKMCANKQAPNMLRFKIFRFPAWGQMFCNILIGSFGKMATNFQQPEFDSVCHYSQITVNLKKKFRHPDVRSEMATRSRWATLPLPWFAISNHLKQSHNLNHSTQSYLENHIDAAQTFCTKFE